MTPKETAKELIFKMEQVIESNCNQSSRDAHFEAAKMCAYIAATEILNGMELDYGVGRYLALTPETFNHWQQVQFEILSYKY